MNRMFKKFFESALLLAVLLQVGPAVGKALPNVVIIFTDDQGYQDVGSYGSPDIATPHLDKMAKQGMRFTDFYVGSSVCTPSRAALLTGKYRPGKQPDHGVIFPYHNKMGLDPAETTLAEVLKGKGYATACVGKWHLGHVDPYLPTNHGFDSYFGIPYSNDMWLAPELKAADDMVLRDNLTLEQMDAMRGYKATDKNQGRVPLMRDKLIVEFPADQAMLTKRYTEETIRFIEEHQEQPFFVYLAHAMPHIPLFASPDFKGKSKGGLYGDTIEEIDWSVGQINDALQRLGLAENTLVVFTSDNGPWLSVKEAGGHAEPLRSGKGTNYEGGQRVPCIMKMPGTIPAGTVNGQVCSTIDLLPTVSALVGAEVESSVDGVDISACLKSPDKKLDRTFFYYNGKTPVAVRDGKWKLIAETPGGDYWLTGSGVTYPDGFKPELYDLENDIGERVNLIHEYPEVAERLMGLMQSL